MAKEEPKGGLLSGIMAQTPLASLGIQPQMLEREIVIEMTEEQLRTMLLDKADQRAKDSVTVKLVEGKLILKIRLW